MASKQPTHALAKRLLVEIEARVARGLAGIIEPEESAKISVAELCEKYVAEFSNPKIKDIEKWRVKIQLVLRRWLPSIGNLPAAELDEKKVARARDAIGNKYAPGSVRNSIVALSGAFAWAVKQGIVSENKVRSVTRPPSPSPRLEFLTADEIKALLAEVERRGEAPGDEGLKWRSRAVAISIAVRLGLRKGELFGLRWRDVDIENRRLTVAKSYSTTPKSGKTRHLRIPAALVPLLIDWREHCPPAATGLVCPVRAGGRWTMAGWSGSDHRLPQLLSAAGCRVFSRPWHMLRHSFASHFMQSGGSLLALAQILGHSDVKVTMIYAHLSSDFLAAELDKVKF